MGESAVKIILSNLPDKYFKSVKEVQFFFNKQMIDFDIFG